MSAERLRGMPSFLHFGLSNDLYYGGASEALGREGEAGSREQGSTSPTTSEVESLSSNIQHICFESH